MVHFKRTLYDEGRASTDYWKLCPVVGLKDYIRADLERKNIKFPRSTLKPRLIHAALRVQRGLMVYDCCDSSELRSFIAARKLEAAGSARWKKQDLIAHLEKADEDAVFGHFQDLPPELRVVIYELHLQDLNTGCIPAQPPITRVSSLLRRESLPLFYQICDFKASTAADTYYGLFTASFFSKAPSCILGRVPKLHVSGTFWVEESFAFYSFTFTLGKRGDDFNIINTYSQNASGSEHAMQVMHERVRNLGIQERGEKLRLQARDLSALQAVFEDVDE